MPEGSSKPRDLTFQDLQSSLSLSPPFYKFLVNMPCEWGPCQLHSGYSWGFAFDTDIDHARIKVQLALQKNTELSPGCYVLRWACVSTRIDLVLEKRLGWG